MLFYNCQKDRAQKRKAQKKFKKGIDKVLQKRYTKDNKREIGSLDWSGGQYKKPLMGASQTG